MALKDKGLYQQCAAIDSRYALEAEIELCHSKEYIERIKALKSKTREELLEMSHNPDSVYYNSETYECALLAAGCVVSCVDQVCSKNVSFNQVKFKFKCLLI
jgi:histone deacetylase 6